MKTKNLDYLNDHPAKILAAICFPLILVNVVLAFTTMLTNELYSKFIGEEFFAVSGYLSAVTSSFSSIITSVMSAAWIKIAHHFLSSDKSSAEQNMCNSFVAIAIVEVVCAFFLVLFTNPILSVLSIPEAIYDSAKLYYIVYVIFYLPAPFAALFLTIVNGTSSSARLFWVNIVVILTNTFSGIFLLAILHGGIVGAALMPMFGALLQLAFYVVLFKRSGFSLHFFKLMRHLDWGKIKEIIAYGILIALQNLLCTSGYLIVTFQTNRYLPSEYISVLSVSLPLMGIISSVSSAIIAFCPPNHALGKKDRLRKFFIISTLCCFGYSVLCFLLYALLGNWYYGRLFKNEQIIAYGSRYWLYYGFGHLFLALVSPLRTFLDSVGLSKLSLLSGIGELLGNLICAFWLIPCFGCVGRSVSNPLGWFLAACLLSIAYVGARKKIF